MSLRFLKSDWTGEIWQVAPVSKTKAQVSEGVPGEREAERATDGCKGSVGREYSDQSSETRGRSSRQARKE
jgi:hypothetical protein